MTQGYYSLIQYCPDLRKLEVCNVGVVLLCPNVPYLGVKMTQSLARVESIFNKKHLPYVEMYKDHFAQGVLNAEIVTLEGLNTFISRLANEFRMTKPRSMRVENAPDVELQKLFKEIFPRVAKSPKKQTPDITAQLQKAIEITVPKNRVAFNLPKVQVPGFSKKITPCFGFQNGRFNLVLSEYFTARKSFSQISYHLFLGQKLSEEPHSIWGRQRLFLLAMTDEDAVKKQIEDNRPTFEAHNVSAHTELPDMVNLVKTEAMDISPAILAEIIRQSA